MLEMASLLDRLFAQTWRLLHSENWGAEQETSNLLTWPGVYMIAFDARDLQPIKLDPKDILYVGMSNSEGGVKQRLSQFKNALMGKRGHSGGKHWFYGSDLKPYDVNAFSKRFYFVSLGIHSGTLKKSASSDDFRKMGLVACLEYLAIARIKDSTGAVPPLNVSAGGSGVIAPEEMLIEEPPDD